MVKQRSAYCTMKQIHKTYDSTPINPSLNGRGDPLQSVFRQQRHPVCHLQHSQVFHRRRGVQSGRRSTPVNRTLRNMLFRHDQHTRLLRSCLEEGRNLRWVSERRRNSTDVSPRTQNSKIVDELLTGPHPRRRPLTVKLEGPSDNLRHYNQDLSSQKPYTGNNQEKKKGRGRVENENQKEA